MQVSPTQGASANGQVSGNAAEPGAAITADFNTFLTLLTTQLRSQDPMNPVDSTQFVAQLAQFSAVEQQTRTNDILKEISGLLSPAQGLGEAGQWLGREVLVQGPGEFDGTTPIDFTFDPDHGATAAYFLVRNDFGQVVSQTAIAPSATSATWAGTLSDRGEAAPGLYTGELLLNKADGSSEIVPGSTYSPVTEVRTQDGQTALYLANGFQIAPADAIGLRFAAPDAG
ncbi:flagellar hook capping FlgD N-terminal domain-containing protein [Oceanibium sediminis]|uniref:flagellar hook capping FlgD N-terminal domain-containing protein n=1 Tax=Oceanibium sediminis TaxID=2026339 RepID=UPI0013002F3B|nr:flagellar hook capping FlgD N-terminal domain-containing protein [Oceanibium sediminis]